LIGVGMSIHGGGGGSVVGDGIDGKDAHHGDRINLNALHQRHNVHHALDGLTPKERHEKEAAAYAFLLIVIVCQVLLFVFKSKYPKRFQQITIAFLWFYPLLMLYNKPDGNVMSMIFIFVWVAWSAKTFSLFKAAKAKPLSPKTPEQVYSWFLRTHTVCYFIGMNSLYMVFFIPGVALLALFFSLYFGVLGRDFAEICAETISNTIGYTKYETAPLNLCALCGEELRPTLQMLASPEDEVEVKVFTLSCGHEFHEQCIRGWSIVGKKETCPFCLEKVDVKSLIPDSPWNSKRVSICWVNLLNVLRFLVVWNPIIVHLDLFVLKLMHFAPIVDTKDA